MNVKLKPPCFVRVKGERVKLRSLSLANAQLKRSGWRGLVAVVQNERGSGLVEYRNLSPDSPSQHAAEEAQAALKQKDEALERAMWQHSDKCNGCNVSRQSVEDYGHIKGCYLAEALSIQPAPSALNAVIDAATAPWRHLLARARANVHHSATHHHGAKSRELLKEIDEAFEHHATAFPKESGAPSGQTAGVASQKAGQPNE